jgi:hypothetical protein
MDPVAKFTMRSDTNTEAQTALLFKQKNIYSSKLYCFFEPKISDSALRVKDELNMADT